MTIALAIETRFSRRVFWLTSPEPDRGMTALLLFCLTMIALGLAADFASGLALGTLALWPVVVATGAALGVLFVEVFRCYRIV
ncbi:MAG: hypothetical protein KDI79_15290 [Anaerolineae bacterium]|nr:hypothetical protein [Anaerolineae bacterium]